MELILKDILILFEKEFLKIFKLLKRFYFYLNTLVLTDFDSISLSY